VRQPPIIGLHTKRKMGPAFSTGHRRSEADTSVNSSTPPVRVRSYKYCPYAHSSPGRCRHSRGSLSTVLRPLRAFLGGEVRNASASAFDGDASPNEFTPLWGALAQPPPTQARIAKGASLFEATLLTAAKILRAGSIRQEKKPAQKRNSSSMLRICRFRSRS
jgi:hypothetical protein